MTNPKMTEPLKVLEALHQLRTVVFSSLKASLNLNQGLWGLSFIFKSLILKG